MNKNKIWKLHKILAKNKEPISKLFNTPDEILEKWIKEKLHTAMEKLASKGSWETWGRRSYYNTACFKTRKVTVSKGLIPIF